MNDADFVNQLFRRKKLSKYRLIIKYVTVWNSFIVWILNEGREKLGSKNHLRIHWELVNREREFFFSSRNQSFECISCQSEKFVRESRRVTQSLVLIYCLFWPSFSTLNQKTKLFPNSQFTRVKQGIAFKNPQKKYIPHKDLTKQTTIIII